MNKTLVAGLTVMVLLLGITSHSLTGSAFAQDGKGVQDKAKADVQKSDSGKKLMTKPEQEKINREKQMAAESSKTAKDKAKVDAFMSTKAKTDAKPVKPAVEAKPVKPAVEAKPVKPAVEAKPVKPAVEAKPVKK